jgi:hypothetical protein
MIRTLGLCFGLLIVPTLAAAQDPKAKLPAPTPQQQGAGFPAVAPTAELPAVTPLPHKAILTAHLQKRLPRARTVQIGSVKWSCSGETCTTTDLGQTPEVSACEALRGQVGMIQGFGGNQRRLTATELQRCNRSQLDPGAGEVAFGDGQPGARPPVPKAGPGAGPHIQAEPLDAPDVRLPTDLPVPPSGAAGLEETDRRRSASEAAEAIREDMARRGAAPEISGFDVYPCLPAHDDTLAIEGRRFGTTAGTRRVVLGPAGRRFEVRWSLAVLSWSDDRIEVLLPPGLPPPPQTWAVAIADGAGEPLSNLRTFRECPGAFRVAGAIAIQSCGASLENIAVDLVRESGGGSYTDRFRVGPDPSNDLAFRYEGMLRPGTYQVTPRLVGGICPGGSWSPGSYSVRISEFDGSPGAPRTDYDFTYENVPLTTTRIPGLILTSQIQTLFEDTELRLNNSGPESPRGSWYKPNDSWIRLSDALGGEEVPLDIPAARGGAMQYYVNDVNLSDVRVSQQGGDVVIRLLFESGGVELKGYCWGTRSMIDLDCPVGPDDSAPDIQIDNLNVRIHLPPARFVPDRGPVAVSYGTPRVVATADVQARGVCEVVDVCGLLIDYEALILTGIETGLQGMLDQRWIKQIVAEALRAATAGPPLGPIGDVNSVRFEGSDLVIRHRP